MADAALREGGTNRTTQERMDRFDPLLRELCPQLFSSLSRSDQRRKGELYLRGLLSADGRKSVRNIASVLGGRATEQSLHHFVSGSTWDWVPVRRALARYTAAVAPPRAWVIRPMVIPKAGENSVGVERRFVADYGQVVSAQRAVGVWSAAEELTTPVSWRLQLPRSWVDVPERRELASIPEGMTADLGADCTVRAYLDIAASWGLPSRPVVVDAREPGMWAAVLELSGAGQPVLARVSGGQRFTVADPAPGAGPAQPQSAHQIMAGARQLRRLVRWRADSGESGAPVALAATVRVRLPSGHGQLVGVGPRIREWPAEYWLTDLPSPAAEIVRLSRLQQRVDRDFTRIALAVGIRDFVGRGFDGWHRHATLASAAHTVLALQNTPY
jgi:SRSO17 transposase